MNAPVNLKGVALANDVLGGTWPIGDYPIFTQSEWRLAADLALADGDYSDLLAMEAEQEEADREEEMERNEEMSRNPRQHFLGGLSMTRSTYRRGYTS